MQYSSRNSCIARFCMSWVQDVTTIKHARKRLIQGIRFCPATSFLTCCSSLATSLAGLFECGKGPRLLDFGKSPETECHDSHSRRNVQGIYRAAEGNGKSGGGLPADLS